jgi:hypothetical protein
MYGFNSGHFVGTSTAMPIQVAIAADTRPCGRAMFKKYTSCPKVCDSASSLMQSIASSKSKNNYTLLLHICTQISQTRD